MSSRWRAAFAALALVVLAAAPLLANGGTVRLSRVPAGRYLVSVFTSPTPLRTGELDVSVLAQDTAGKVVQGLQVLVEASPVGADTLSTDTLTIRHPATREQATNKLFQAAKFDVAVAGEWIFRIQVGGAEGGVVSFRATLTEPTLLDRPYLLALLVLLPIALLAWLFSRAGTEDDRDARAEQARRETASA